MLKTGMTLGERYEIVSKIGTGGMADVYKAKDHLLNRFVAVKILKPEYREATAFIQKFRSEAQAAAGLTHTNIVNVFDVGEDDGNHYIVMELIEGITLKDYISKKGMLSVKEATSIAIQVSMGLEAAHSHGIIHRDVKPQNIMINVDGKVKVTDFGIARAVSSNTITSNAMGSVRYSSPEQVRGGYSDEKSDIYSLGITLYEMITGRVPFDGDSTVAIAVKHLQEEMTKPSVFAPDLPYSLEKIILKCTQKRIDRRYQKMEDVIADLKRSLIEPDGDFVKMSSGDENGKTVIIGEGDLKKIKGTTSKVTVKSKKYDDEAEGDEPYIDDEDDEPEDTPVKPREKKARPAGKKSGMALKIGGVAAAVLILAAGGYVISQKLGSPAESEPIVATTTVETPTETKLDDKLLEDEGTIEVPNLVGMKEEDAGNAVKDLNVGLQFGGEEFSDLDKGVIASQNPAPGTKVTENSTISYKISKGPDLFILPDYVMTMYQEPLQELLDNGMIVVIEKQYHDIAAEDFILSVSHEAGEALKKGTVVTLAVSDNNVLYGPVADHTYYPDGTDREGRPEEETAAEETAAETAETEEGTEAVEGTETAEAAEGTETTEGTETAETTADTTANAVWMCTQKLESPGADYKGGPLKLELVQSVNGVVQATTLVDGQILQFPYQLNIVGESGIESGELHISEQVDGAYVVLGYYPIKFKAQG